MIDWLVAVYRCRKLCKKALFSWRRNFLDELRPKINGGRIAYPDAWLHITNKDATRAKSFADSMRGKAQ